MISSRRAKSLIARPRISSLLPSEWRFAVSKKLMPTSSARLMNGRLYSSPRLQASPGCANDTHDLAQRWSYSSWRRHQTPVSLRPLGGAASHWYMPQRPSSPRIGGIGVVDDPLVSKIQTKGSTADRRPDAAPRSIRRKTFR